MSFSNLSSIFPDREAANKGRWFDIPSAPGEPEIAIKLAYYGRENRLWGPAALKMAARIGGIDKAKAAAASLEKGNKKNEDMAFREVAIVFAQAIVKGWRGITRQGKTFPFNEKNCIELFNSTPPFLDWAYTIAINKKNFLLPEELVGPGPMPSERVKKKSQASSKAS